MPVFFFYGPVESYEVSSYDTQPVPPFVYQVALINGSKQMYIILCTIHIFIYILYAFEIMQNIGLDSIGLN